MIFCPGLSGLHCIELVLETPGANTWRMSPADFGHQIQSHVTSPQGSARWLRFPDTPWLGRKVQVIQGDQEKQMRWGLIDWECKIITQGYSKPFEL